MEEEATCPICLKQIHEAYITVCGHSYCYQCIAVYLHTSSNCPSCKAELNMSQIFPNYALNNIIERATAMGSQIKPHLAPVKQLEASLLRNEKDLSINDINGLLATLMEKKARMEAEERQVETEVLLDFLQRTREQKQEEIARLTREVELLDDDIMKVEKERMQFSLHSGDKRPFPETKKDGIIAKKRRIMGHREALESCYFGYHYLKGFDASPSVASVPTKLVNENGKEMPSPLANGLKEEQEEGEVLGTGRPLGLDVFTQKLSKLVKFSGYEVMASLKFGDVNNEDMSVVSSISFDRDDEFFAMGGVTKKIRIYEYSPIVNAPTQMHFPVNEIKCDTRLSCVRWSPYIKLQMAASGYNGQVYIWDASTSQCVNSLTEHEKRIWSIDYSYIDPTKIASASDDTRVKVWATNQKKSAMTIEGGSNICSVKFNPASSTTIAFGSSDHNIYYYDLRNIYSPLFVLKEHQRAVSYVDFLNADELVSASIDSTVKLWNTATNNKSVRTFEDHTNRRNFVGLAVVMDDFITIGSEENTLYTYYKELNKSILSYDFGSNEPSALGKSDELFVHMPPKSYVSAICAKKDSNKLLAANSKGIVRLLKLV